MRISVRWSLVVGFLGLIWGTHLITASSAFFTSQKALNRHARKIMDTVADRARIQTVAYLDQARRTALLTASMLTSRHFDLKTDQTNPLFTYFHNQMVMQPSLAGIFIGCPNGDFLDLRRSNIDGKPAFRIKIISSADSDRKVLFAWYNDRWTLLKEKHDPNDSYDPRQRPWYQSAAKASGTIWTDPYIFFSSQKPGITAATPLFDKSSGAITGVVGVDIEIDALSTFFANLKIGEHGKAFLIDGKGNLVAFPDLEKIKTPSEGDSKRFRLVSINQLSDPLSSKAFSVMAFQRNAAKQYQFPASRYATFEHLGQQYLSMFKALDEKSLGWAIGVYLPSNDYLSAIIKNRRLNLFLTLAISAVATLIGFFVASGIIKPVSRLASQANAIERGDYDAIQPIKTPYREIQSTADAFEQMKTAVFASREKYKSIFENIQDIYYEITLDGTIIEISPSVYRIYKYSRKQLLGKNMFHFYKRPEDRHKLLELLNKHGRLTDYEIVLIHPDKHQIIASINCTLARDATGQPNRIIGSLRDITPRKLAEARLRAYKNKLEEIIKKRTSALEKANADLRSQIAQRQKTAKALRHSEERYRNILASIQEAYFEIDLSGRLTFVNEAALKVAGYTKPEEVIGLHHSEYTSPETASRAKKIFEELRRTGKPTNIARYTLITRDGQKRIMEVSASLIKDSKGRPTGYRGVARDITDRIRNEREKEKLKSQLEQALRMESIGTLAGGVAHDFNNLLMGIQGNVSLLLMKIGKESELRQYIEAIQDCVESGSSLTSQLLGFARGGKYNVLPIDLNEAIDNSLRLFGRTRRSITINKQLGKNLWTVEADRSQIEQVLMNIYVNAWQAIEDTGQITVRSTNVHLGPEQVKGYGAAPGRYVEISIQDTGRGMPENVRKRIFEPFFTTKQMGRGTGLGLASVFGIVKNHKGFLKVDSQLGKGSIFTIYLPASGKNSKKSGQIQSERNYEKGNETILVIDDEPYICEAFEDLLKMMGYNVIACQAPRKAINIIREKQKEIDLAIVDMVMPEMDGEELFKNIMEIQPEIKVIIASGYTKDKRVEKLIAKGAAGFIQKPFNPSSLSIAIRKALDT